MSNTHDATFYIQIEPEWSSYANREGERNLLGIKAVSITQKRPAKTRGGRSGTVITKLTLRLPDTAFLPLRPEAVIIIPADMTAVDPIEVEAQDPNDDA